MHFIIGGAFQGKLEYAKREYMLDDSEVFICSAEKDVEFGARCIYKIEEYTFRCVKNGVDAVEVFRAGRDKWADSVLICGDIFCGVVPVEKDMRAWRDMTGRLCAYLSSQAESVVRIFCGLEQRLK